MHRFIALGFIELHGRFVFYKLKARPLASKKMTACFIATLYRDTCFIVEVWNQTRDIFEARICGDLLQWQQETNTIASRAFIL